MFSGNNFDLQEELKNLPEHPGVYIMKDVSDVVIYVGKAKSLRNRVRSYFQAHNAEEIKHRVMVPLIASFDYIVVDSEVEAFILENNLIKKYWPRFNVKLKDDRSYPYIKFTGNEEFPRVMMVYKQSKDNAKYYGPFPSYITVMEVINLLREIWPLRTCGKSMKKRACLNYHIGQCLAPCEGKISKEDYNSTAECVESFLNGNHSDVLKKLEAEMNDASENLEYEKAGVLRDKIFAVKRFVNKQKLDKTTGGDMDIAAFARLNDEAMVQLFTMRGGKMQGREHHLMNGAQGLSDGEVMNAFILQFYEGNPDIPKEIVLQTEIEDVDAISEILSNQKGSKVSMTIPRKGEKLKLIEMAKRNADIALERHGGFKTSANNAVKELAEIIGVNEDCLGRVEAYDISNTQGFESVGSMVVYENGKPKRRDYRKFKIKTVEGADDCASITEVLTRRFNRFKSGENGSFSKLPGVLFIDGGKGQVAAVAEVIETFGYNIPVCGMIKDDKHRTRGLLFDGIEVEMRRTSESFKLLTRIQDEVHRFAVEYHRKLREKKMVKSELDDIKGIGESRKKSLMLHFGSIERIKTAKLEELHKVTGNSSSAEAVYNYFNNIEVV